MHIQLATIGLKMSDVEEQVIEEQELKIPNLWRVIFHNDDKTTMDFVIFLLVKVFHKGPEEAMHLTMEVHSEGAAIVGVYTHEIAESKMNICINTARKSGHPLNVSIEEDA